MIAGRLAAQALCGPPLPDPVAVAERLLAVQAQDGRGARLAVRARTQGLTAGDVDRALTQDRSLIITWLNRGTLHLVRREDRPWLQALTTPPVATANARRLAQEGVSPDAAERGVGVLERALGEDGPLTRTQLRGRLDAAGVPTAGQALIHLLMLASLRGLIVRGPMVGREQAFVLVRDWLGETPAVDRDVALAELARRYLAGHGPASDRDLARWAGMPLRDVRAGLAAISGELAQRDNGLVDLAARPPVGQESHPPRLLGPFEPVLLGWVSREDVLDGHGSLVTMNGIFRAFALVEGRAAAAWGMPGGKVTLEPFRALTPAEAAALEAEAADVKRFLGGEPLGAPLPSGR